MRLGPGPQPTNVSVAVAANGLADVVDVVPRVRPGGRQVTKAGLARLNGARGSAVLRDEAPGTNRRAGSRRSELVHRSRAGAGGRASVAAIGAHVRGSAWA